MSDNILVKYPIQTLLFVFSGLGALVVAIILGLWRAGGLEAIVVGTWLGSLSALSWYLAAVFPLIWADRHFCTAGLNVLAACCAAGAVCYSVPPSDLPTIIPTFIFVGLAAAGLFSLAGGGVAVLYSVRRTLARARRD